MTAVVACEYQILLATLCLLLHKTINVIAPIIIAFLKMNKKIMRELMELQREEEEEEDVATTTSGWKKRVSLGSIK